MAAKPEGLEASAVRDHVTSYLSGRGSGPASQASSTVASSAAAFVCEEDVREAIKANSKIVIGERTIVTPSARDLAETHGVFVISGWPRP